ncbi:MAG: hypothetical protein F9K16_10025, partial [Thermoanaerobaculia bacterium]
MGGDRRLRLPGREQGEPAAAGAHRDPRAGGGVAHPLPVSDPARLLLGDVGGTWIRFARAAAEGPLVGLRALPAAQFAGLAEAVARYRELEALPAGAFDAAGFAVAGPVSGDTVELTNLPWMLSGEALRDALGLTRLV